jgi:uncharacterized membrane protein
MGISIKRCIPLFLLDFCLLIPVSFLNTAQEQEKQQEIQEQAIAVNIEVPVRVYDGNKFVENLTIKDFVIYEDGKKQDIDVVYLIKERAIERKESVEEETVPKKKEMEKKFAPQEQRHFVFVFELLEYLPQINDVIDYFFQNVMQPSDAVNVITPVSSYRLTPESLQTKTKDQIAEISAWSLPPISLLMTGCLTSEGSSKKNSSILEKL